MTPSSGPTANARRALAALLDTTGRRLRDAASVVRPATGEPSDDELRSRWETWIPRIQQEIATLQDHGASWHELEEATARNPSIPQPNHVLEWIRELYGVVVAIGIRRQADRAADVVNLARLMDDIARHPDALSREWYLDKYPVEMRDMAATTFDKFAGADRSHVDRAIIQGDLATLRSIAKKVTVYVNKHVAHAAETPNVEIPTYEDLVRVLESFDALVRRYYLLVEGSGLVTSTPRKQYSFLRPLIVAWVPNNRVLQLLRERGDLPYDPSDAERLAREALSQSGVPDATVVEGLLEEIERLRAQLG